MAVLTQKPAGSRPPKQSGLTLWSALYVLITLGVIVLVGVRSVPVYLNNHEIQRALGEVAHNPSLRHAERVRIQRAVSKHLQAGYASGVTSRDVTITRDGNQRRLELRYEVRRPLMFNIGIIYAFHDVAAMPSGGGG